MAYVSRYHDTVKDLLTMLVEKGFRIIYSNDGGDELKEASIENTTSFLTQVDESVVRVSKGNKKISIFIVLGNDFSEIVCNYTISDTPECREFAAVVHAHYEKWEGK